MRIVNRQQLSSHGNLQGREDILQVMEAGLTASDPYYNTQRLVRLSGNTLTIGCAAFEADQDPQSGVDQYDIGEFRHIWVVGAGKGVQRVAKALEDTLGDRLTGGHVIGKIGDPVILRRVGVTLGRHPTPDENCLAGSRKIVDIASRVGENDLVFTIITNGASSLMTLPVPGVSLSDVADMTRLMQIELGVSTRLLNKVRNHIDQLKGGKLARLFSKARLVNIAGADLNHADDTSPRDFAYFVEHNCWLHNMPEASTFQDARAVLRQCDAWDRCPPTIQAALEAADPAYESVRYGEFATYRQRMFGICPEAESFYKVAMASAKALGYHPYLLADSTTVEASCVGKLLASMALCIESGESTIKAPAALVLTGEMIVTVGKNNGVGGRNQEFALALASRIAGSARIVAAAADTDGTDGPGGFTQEGAPQCLAGGVVDGYTASEIAGKGIDIDLALRTHSTTGALYNTGNAIHAEQGISLNDLVVVLVKE